MMTWLMTSLLVAGPGMALAVPADTTLELRRGDRVVVERLSGELRVETWARSTLSLGGDGDELRWVGVARAGGVVTVHPDDRKARRRDVDMVLRVPAWVDLEVEGRELDVDVSGVEGTVSVKNVSGDISIRGPARRVDVSSMEGEVEVRGARGPVTAQSRGDDVAVYDIRGDVDLESGDGDLRLERVTATHARAETLDGDVFFSGTLVAGGTYTLSVHDGDATVVIPDDASAEVSVSTFDGDFSSEFPVTLKGYQGKGKFDFSLGKGGARLDVKVFDGEIRLQRMGGS